MVNFPVELETLRQGTTLKSTLNLGSYLRAGLLSTYSYISSSSSSSASRCWIFFNHVPLLELLTLSTRKWRAGADCSFLYSSSLSAGSKGPSLSSTFFISTFDGSVMRIKLLCPFMAFTQFLGVTFVTLCDRFNFVASGLLCKGGVLGCLGVAFSSSNLLITTTSPALLAPKIFTAVFCGVGEGEGEGGTGEGAGEMGVGEIAVRGFG
jgi:hypothetical protein